MPSIVRVGALEARLADGAAELRAAQALRYRVFVEVLGAQVDGACHAARLEVDRFDGLCDHLIVVETGRPVRRVLGCYRLLRRDVAARGGGFWSAAEFALGPLARHGCRSVEVGRACVDPDWRQGPVVQLLWRGIAEYLEDHAVDVLFGCASLPGTDVEAHAPLLAWLHARHLAPPRLRPSALAARRARIEPSPGQPLLDDAAALAMLPPLLRGYLRLGAKIGDGAVVDPVFNTVDVCVVLPTERLAARYRPAARPVKPVAAEPAGDLRA